MSTKLFGTVNNKNKDKKKLNITRGQYFFRNLKILCSLMKKGLR